MGRGWVVVLANVLTQDSLLWTLSDYLGQVLIHSLVSSKLYVYLSLGLDGKSISCP